MSENKQQFEKLSFRQLLESRKVEIPIIQRDYAQGRAKQEKVRNEFLDALKNALTGCPVELDFVYGSEEKSVLQPLDGQQRLTTLFLLHWFIANKEGKLGEAKFLSEFTYETRTSSREFCKELVDKSIDYQNLLPINNDAVTAENQLSETIKNAAWFVESWQKDPTISAMLIMLDAIQAKFKDTSDIWGKLTKIAEDKRPITFLYIKLEDFGLSDDLYIKMNARGKQLTPFENFKSRFDKYIEKNGWGKDITNPLETFAHKIDTVWTDLFWKYRTDDGLIDNKLVNFIVGVAIICYAQNLKIQPNKEDEEKVRKELIEKKRTKNITEDAIKRERIEKRIEDLTNNPDKISSEDFMTKEAFDCLVMCLNKYAERPNDNFSNIELRTNITFWKDEDSTLFNVFIQEKTTYSQRLLFYAQTIYLLKNQSFNASHFSDWMRVVRNIVYNNDFNHAPNFIGAIGLIRELSKGCNDIYNYLYSTPQLLSNVAKEEVKEEIEKAKIIIANSDAKQIIHDTEDTEFCTGKIDFALYCIDYDIDNNPNSKDFEITKLKDIKNVIETHFKNNDDAEQFRQAFLTIAGNDYYQKTWWSVSYSFDCMKGYLCYPLEMKDFSRIKDWHRDYLKELFSQLVSKRDLKKIIDDFIIPINMPNWKQRLIKEDGLLKDAAYVLVPNNDNSFCYLARQQRPSRDDQVKKIE